MNKKHIRVQSVMVVLCNGYIVRRGSVAKDNVRAWFAFLYLMITPERAGTYLDIGADILNLLTRDAVASAETSLGI